MGKGASDPNCPQSISTSMADLLNPAPVEGGSGISGFDPLAVQAAILSDPELRADAEQHTAKVSEDKSRARGIESFERKWAEDTLDYVHKMRSEGRSEQEVNRYFNRRARDVVKKRSRDLEEVSWPDKPQGPADLTPGSLAEKVLVGTTITQVYDPSGEESLQFQEEFMNSPDFINSLKHILARETATDSNSKAVSGKEMEDAYREAALLTIGISDDVETLGKWVSPSGTEYKVEVLREFSSTALMDIIMMAKPIDSDEAGIYTMQWKSYQTNDSKEHTPTPGDERKTKSVKISTLTKLSGRKKNSVEALVRETQVRFLATNTFADTSAYNQNDVNGETELITHTTRLSRPEVHRAIARTPDLAKRFRPAKKKDGSYGFLEAVLPVRGSSGEEFKVKIGTQMSPRLDKVGRPIFRNGVCLVDETSVSNKGNIEIDIEHTGWHRIHTIGCMSRRWAETAARYPEKLKELGISLDN